MYAILKFFYINFFSFWLTLLTDAIPLLECDDLVFSSNDTLMMIHYLEEKQNLPELKGKVDLIRFACTRNLARALMYEAQAIN